MKFIKLPLIATALVLVSAGCCNVDKKADGPIQTKEFKLPPQVTVTTFETTPAGRPIRKFNIVGAGGLRVELMEHGARISAIESADRKGVYKNITLGWNNVEAYEKIDVYPGATIGRYGNRIGKGSFTLEGRTYTLPLNNENKGLLCTLHGGTETFSHKLWLGEVIRKQSDGSVGVKFTYTSPDGDQGFPGTLAMEVRYLVTPSNALRIEYKATTDKTTIVNLTNHVYFNLKGEANGNILDHELQIFGSKITPVHKGLWPTGKYMDVKGTPFDFTKPHLIGERVNDKSHEQIVFGNGYDHNWVLDKKYKEFGCAAILTEETTGRKIEVWTSEPGMQFYCGNFMSERMPTYDGKGKWAYRGALALETQHYPDSPNQKAFPSTVLRPGETYSTVTEYRFGLKK